MRRTQLHFHIRYRNTLFLLISVYFYLFQSTSLYAQADSLSNYLEIAVRNNPAVLQRFTEYEAALKKITQAGSLPDPQLDIGVFISPMELVSGNQVADLKLMQMFPWFGVLKNAKDEMSLMAKAKYEQFNDAKLQVSYDVKRTYYELFRVRKDIVISEKNIGILKEIEQLSLIRYKAPSSGNQGPSNQQPGIQTQGSINVSSSLNSGMQTMGGSQTVRGQSSSTQGNGSMQQGGMTSSSDGSGLTDLYRIQIEAGELKNDIALLKNQEQTITAQFNSFLNRPPERYVTTGKGLIKDTLNLDLAAVSDSIQRHNPMLGMISYEKDAYQARKKMVTVMGYPMVGIGVNYSVISRSDMSTSSMNGKDMIMPMLSVTLPVYRKKYTAMREEADLLSKVSSQNYQATSNSLAAELYEAVQLYRDALRRIKLYEDQYLLASKSFEIMMKSFSTSSTPLTDVLRIRQQALDYETRQVAAIVDLNTAKAWIIKLEGNK